jgi:hypothetical protein
MAPTSKAWPSEVNCYGICNSHTGLWPHFSSHFLPGICPNDQIPNLTFFRTSQNPSQIATKKPYWILFHGGHNPQWISIFFMVKLHLNCHIQDILRSSPHISPTSQSWRRAAARDPARPWGMRPWTEPLWEDLGVLQHMICRDTCIYIYILYVINQAIKQSSNQAIKSNQIESNQINQAFNQSIKSINIYIHVYIIISDYIYIWHYMIIYVNIYAYFILGQSRHRLDMIPFLCVIITYALLNTYTSPMTSMA